MGQPPPGQQRHTRAGRAAERVDALTDFLFVARLHRTIAASLNRGRL